MFIATRDTKLIAIHGVEWQCRRKAKGLSKSKYWTWLDSVTSGDPPVPDYSGEDYEIVETDTNFTSFVQSGHIVSNLDGTLYHLKWDGSKVIKDDDALATYQLAEKWKRVRSQRDNLLSQSDWVVIKAKETGGTISSAWKAYRQDLRDIPSQSDPDNITWPTKPA